MATPDSAVHAVAMDYQLGQVLADRESKILGLGVQLYRSNKMTPEMALAMWGELAAIQSIEADLERNVRKAIHQAELEVVDGEN